MEDRAYRVKLHCEPGSITPSQRIAAEVRFICALERSLGSTEAVIDAYKAWSAAPKPQVPQTDRAMAALAHRWTQAYEAAAAKGLDGIHGAQDPTFTVALH